MQTAVNSALQFTFHISQLTYPLTQRTGKLTRWHLLFIL